MSFRKLSTTKCFKNQFLRHTAHSTNKYPQLHMELLEVRLQLKELLTYYNEDISTRLMF